MTFKHEEDRWEKYKWRRVFAWTPKLVVLDVGPEVTRKHWVWLGIVEKRISSESTGVYYRPVGSTGRGIMA